MLTKLATFLSVVTLVHGCVPGGVDIVGPDGNTAGSGGTGGSGGGGGSSSTFQELLKSKLGIGNEQLIPFEGGGLPLFSNPHALDCNFHYEEKCCWSNVGQKADELDYAVADLHTANFSGNGEFRSIVRPEGPALLTGSPRTKDSYQALLLSCTIMCQSATNRLTLSHWLSPGVKLDVCKVELGKRNFEDCVTITGTRTSTVEVPGHSRPFYLALVASGFTNLDGGLAIVDDLVYNGEFCGPTDELENQSGKTK